MKIILVAFLLLAARSFPLSENTAPVTTAIEVTSPEVVIGGGPQHQEDPHISGSLVTYSDLNDPYVTMVRYLRSGERNIYWQPAGGGAETALSFALNHQNPSVRDGLIVFEAELNSTYDVYAYDTSTATLYRVTSSPEPETLSDLQVVGDAGDADAWTGAAQQIRSTLGCA